MKLTGKSLEQFEKWYREKTKYDFSLNYIKLIAVEYMSFNPTWSMDAFNCSPDSMRFGVLVDFFDSVGIEIEVGIFIKDIWIFTINSKDHVKCESRPQARAKAIEKANEIYNNR